MAIKTKDSKEDLKEKKLGMDIIDNMGYQAQKEKNMEMAGGIKFRDLIILTFMVGNLDLSIIAEVNPALPPPTTQIDFII